MIKGYQCKAQYKEQSLKINQGNAWIEALPDRLSTEEFFDMLYSAPQTEWEHENMDVEDRIYMIQLIGETFWFPLPPHITKYRQMYNMLKIGYLSRNPHSPEYNRQYAIGIDKVFEHGVDEKGFNLAGIKHSAVGYAEIGLSGLGKSVLMERMLQLCFPQVIHHVNYKGLSLPETQVVWIKVETPSGKSVGDLCRNFYSCVDKILGTKFLEEIGMKSENSIQKLVQNMVKVANNINLGVLIIDEIQRVSRQHSGGDERMIEFITELTNTLGIPIVIIGTFKALYLFKRSVANTRRAIPTSYTENITDRLTEGSWEWDKFISQLWRLQYTKSSTLLTPELKNLMYYHSVGIPDISVKLFMHVQCAAIIQGGNEIITIELINEVAGRSLRLLQPIFERVRSGEASALLEIDDITPEWKEFNEYLNLAKHRIYVHGQLAKDHARTLQKRNETQIIENLITYALPLVKDMTKAEELSRRVFEASNGMASMDSMFEHLAALALEQMNSRTNKSKKSSEDNIPLLSKKKKGEKPLLEPEDIRFIVAEGSKKGLAVEEALLAVGYVKTMTTGFL